MLGLLTRRTMNLKLSIGAVILSIVIGLVIRERREGHGHARPVPEEAVPIYRTKELHWAVRFFVGYVAGLIPLRSMTACPTTLANWEDGSEEADEARRCMNPARRSVEGLDVAVVRLLSAFGIIRRFDEETVLVDRADGGDPLKVTLARKQGSNSGGREAPLILYIHGGGFTMRAMQKTLAYQMFDALLRLEEGESSPAMDGATWASVEYRLAPESAYPAATEDCLLALNHLVKVMGLGGGGVHVAGVSAGATLAMETTLKSLGTVDTFYVDEPVVALPTNDGRDMWWMNSPSLRRYAYARTPDAAWLDWCLKAYTGAETLPDAEEDLPLGTVATSVDITGGATTASEWVEGSGRPPALPPLILVTADGDPLRDGGLAFGDAYERAANAAGGVGATPPRIRRFRASSGHVNFYILEGALFREVMRAWHGEIGAARERKFGRGPEGV